MEYTIYWLEKFWLWLHKTKLKIVRLYVVLLLLYFGGPDKCIVHFYAVLGC